MWSWPIHLSLFGHNLQTFNKYLLGSISSQGIFQMAQIICGGVEKAKDYTPKVPFMRHWRQEGWNSNLIMLSDQANLCNSEQQLSIYKYVCWEKSNDREYMVDNQ